MACQQPRGTVCASISDGLQTPSSAFVCSLLFSFGQKICPEKTCLLVPAPKTPCRGLGDSNVLKVNREKATMQNTLDYLPGVSKI